jgi:hypothetical protein
MSDDLRYPIGKFNPVETLTDDDRRKMIDDIAAQPARFRDAVRGWTDTQLDTPYRPGGWTVRQVIHHVPESHLNSYVRFKWTLTENEPTIKPYAQDAWSALPDSKLPIEMSLRLLEALHVRWVELLRCMTPDQWRRRLHHPESGTFNLDRMLQVYVWHGNHHLAHITRLKERMKW